jgi:hypothetical protein
LSTSGDHGLRVTEATNTTVGSAFFLSLNPQTTYTNIINGSSENSAAVGVAGATIGGGGFVDFGTATSYTNSVQGHFGTVSGGFANAALGVVAVVGGGHNNEAGGGHSTVSGGRRNQASGHRATVGGGSDNSASNVGSTVSGGTENAASGDGSAVGGGSSNAASGSKAFVGGGSNNAATGTAGTVPGGVSNTAAGDFSVAMGYRAKTLGRGSFQFADSSFHDFSSSTADSFRVRATGGVRFVTDIDNTGAITWSCAAFAGASWSCSSDRNLKHSLKKLDGRKVLAKLAAMPVYQWQPKGQNTHVKHVGPMAQDFMKAFGVGDDDKMIGMQDADGVALAAIQGLNQIVKAKDAKIAALEKANAIMLKKLAAIERKLGL